MIDKTELGRRLRDVRRERNLTLKELDHLSGFSATHISEIERGKTSPTIGALVRIARALGREPSYFIETDALPDTAHVSAEARESRLWNGARAEVLTPGVPGGRLSAHRLTLAPEIPGLELPAGAGSVGGIVLAGRLRVESGPESYDLDAGSAFYLALEEPARLAAIGGEGAELFVVSTDDRSG